MNKGDACWSAGLMKGAATQDSITLLLHSHLRKPPALPEVADLLRQIRSLFLKRLQRNFIT